MYFYTKISHVSRFLFLDFLADLGKLGGILKVAIIVGLSPPPPDTLHPSARSRSESLCTHIALKEH